jgi:hypothetical protein
MKVTHNEAIAGSRAFYGAANLRIEKQMAKEAYAKACRAYDRAYREIQQAELAKLEADDDD